MSFNILKTKNLLATFRKLKLGTRLLLILVILVAVPVTVGLVSRFVIYQSQAATVKMYFSPSTVSLTSSSPDANLSLIADVRSTELVFSDIEITFNKSSIQLSGEVDTSASPLSYIVKKTSVSEVNSTGKIRVISAVPGGSSAPKGKVPLFSLPIRLNDNYSGSTTQGEVVVVANELIDSNNKQFRIGRIQSATVNQK